MKNEEVIAFTKKMLKEQEHWLNHFIYMHKTRYSDYTQEIKNKRFCVAYLKRILKVFEKYDK